MKKNASIRGFKKASQRRWDEEGYYGSKTIGPKTDAEYKAARTRTVKRLKSQTKAKRKRNIIPPVPLPTAISQVSSGAQVAKFLRTGKLNKGKRNPAAEAEQGFEDFHGYPSEETVVVKEQIHFHRHLSAAGELEYIVIDTRDGKYRVTVKFKRGETILAFNEKRNQLFVRGGDQSVDLREFGINPKEAHELETLGPAKKIGYFTTKTHLGEDGGTAIYDHGFRMTNENGRHVTVRIAKYPDVIYRVRDKHLEFSGGSYKILPEGIDK
jgi:hypothetical protein